MGELVFLIALPLAFVAGLRLGVWAEAVRWREKATHPPRMLSGGRFFYVVEDNDVWKARDVLQGMETKKP